MWLELYRVRQPIKRVTQLPALASRAPAGTPEQHLRYGKVCKTVRLQGELKQRPPPTLLWCKSSSFNCTLWKNARKLFRFFSSLC